MRTSDRPARGSLLDLLGEQPAPPVRDDRSILELLNQPAAAEPASVPLQVPHKTPVSASPPPQEPAPPPEQALDRLERALADARRQHHPAEAKAEPASKPVLAPESTRPQLPTPVRPPVVTSTPPRADALSPAAMARRLISKWYWIAAGGLAGASLLALYSLTLPNEYQAISRIVLEPRGITPIRDSVAPQGLNSEATIAYSQSQVDIIRSLSVLAPVVETEDLANDREFADNRTWLDKLGLEGLSAALFDERAEPGSNDIVEQVQRQLYVGRLNQSFVIEIGFVSEDPFKAARIANAITRSYIASESGAQSDASEKASADLTGSLAALRARVAASEEQIEAHKRKFGLVETNGRLVDEESLSRLNEQLARATAATAEARSQVELSNSIDVNDVVGGGLPSALQTQAMAQARLQYQRSRSALSRLSVKLGERHPQLREAAAELRAAEANITAELKRIAAANQRELARTQSREADLRGSVATLRERSLESNAPKAQLRELERQLEADRRVYENFLQRSRETGEQTAIASRNARIISDAVPPTRKVGPMRTLMTIGGGVAGSAAAAVALLLPALLHAGTAFQRGLPAPVAPVAPVAPAKLRPRAAPAVRDEDDLYGDGPVVVPAAPPNEVERPERTRMKSARKKAGRTDPPAPSTAEADRLREERDRLAAELERARKKHRSRERKSERQLTKAWDDGLNAARREAEILEAARREAAELRRRASAPFPPAFPAYPPMPYGYAPAPWPHPAPPAHGYGRSDRDD